MFYFENVTYEKESGHFVRMKNAHIQHLNFVLNLVLYMSNEPPVNKHVAPN